MANSSPKTRYDEEKNNHCLYLPFYHITYLFIYLGRLYRS